MLIREIGRPGLKQGLIGLRDFADKASRRIRSADLTALRRIRQHPRATAALALLTGLTSGMVVGAIMQQRIHER